MDPAKHLHLTRSKIEIRKSKSEIPISIFAKSQPAASAGSGVICSYRPLAYAVIPAKAGIQSLDNAFPEVCGVDSRFHGNDGVGSTLSMQMTPPLVSHNQQSTIVNRKSSEDRH
jgi:hypothetical protein